MNGGHLLILNTQDEVNIVYELLHGLNPPKGLTYAGLTNMNEDRVLRDTFSKYLY